MRKHTQLILLVAILLVAAAGRILNIDQESLWVDEGFSYWTIREGNDLFEVVLNDVHPPVYFVLLKGWSSLTGITELALRYLSVLPSLLSVALVYQVAREMVRRVALRHQHGAGIITRSEDRQRMAQIIPLLAALLLALADMENYIAQETRMYTWHVLWVLLSMWGLLHWSRRATRLSHAVWFGGSLLLVYTHYIGLAALAVQGMYALLFLRGGRRLVAIGTLALVGVLFIPWLLVVVSNQTANIGTGFNVPSTLESLWNYRVEWFTQQWALMIGLALLGAGWLMTAAYSSRYDDEHPYIKAPFASLQQSAGVGMAFLLLGWIIVPVAGAYVLNLHTPILIDYRLTQITPAVALLIAFGLAAFRGRVLLFLVVVITVYGVAIDDTPRPRPPWREVGMTAADYAQPDDLALALVTPSGDWQVIYYYDRFMPESVRNVSLRQWQLERGYEDYLATIPALLAEHDHVWLMHWSSDTSPFELLRESGHVQTAVFASNWLGNALNTYRFDRIPAPDVAITRFEPGMVLRDVAIAADNLRVDLWWSADSPLDADYSVSARLLDTDGRLVAQVDTFPQDNQRPTTTWQPDEVIYDPRTLTLADGITALNPGTYTVAVSVYLWTPDGIIEQMTAAGEPFAIVGEMVVE